MTSPELSEKIERWIEQVSSEIILSDPGTDRSQFPLRDLLNSLVEKSDGVAGLEAFNECASTAMALVERLMFSGTVYSVGDLDALNALASQMNPLLRDSTRLFKAPASPSAAGPAEAAPTIPIPLPDDLAEASQPEAIELATLNADTDLDLLKEFVTEACEHLDNIEQGVLFLEENPDDADTIASIFRAFHTIKGGSGFLGIAPVNRLAHELESLLDLIRNGELPVDRTIVEIILEGADTFRSYTNEIQSQLAGGSRLQPVMVLTEQLIVKARLIQANPGEKIQAGDVAAPAPAAAAATSPAATGAKEKSSGPVGGMIKVDIQKFDALMDLVGELVIAQSLVAQDPGLVSTASQNLQRNMSQMGMITNGLQKAAMSLRMVPIRSTFQKMNRLVRDTAIAKEKFAELVLSGEDTEMDRTIVEELSDPLLHMVRNSVDHGIESPAEREAAGKPRAGKICLAASHVGGNILVEISDDGAGLRSDIILAKAITRGMLPPGTTLPEKEIFDLIFAPGFSTAAKVTDLSGRGVGMDVVKRNITRLRGKIEIESTPGRGTSFKIFLPLTLAIIDGLMVSVGSQRYIIPTLSVRESFRPTPDMLSTVQGRGEMVNVRGSLLPLLRLCQHFGITPRSTDPSQSMVVVVESAHEARCILVDDLIGQQEVVIKSLGDSFKNNHMLSGAAILGDGRVGLILDPRSLVQIRETQTIMA